jgi:hypothetical protein
VTGGLIGMSDPIVVTEPLGGSPLARAGIEGRLGDWYVARPTSVAGWTARAEAVRASTSDRDWLGALAPAFAATARAAAHASSVSRTGGASS